MRILQVNKFFYLKGGPERYMFGLSGLLESNGHKIAFFSMDHKKNQHSEWGRYFVDNVEYNKRHRVVEQAKIFQRTLFSKEAERKMLELLDNFRPDIAHIHNFNHQLTPSILYALKRRNVPVVMTVHDYKLVCPSYAMLNHGHICELCKGKRFYQCFKTRCHKESYSKSFLSALESYLHHQILSSYKYIDYFLCPSKFIMDKLQEMGLKGKFFHRPNFVDIKKIRRAGIKNKKRIVYWGRLSYEKGIETLIEAVEELPVELDIIGEGPLRGKIEKRVKEKGMRNIRLCGYLKSEDLFAKIQESVAAVIPSECYENNPISVLEAFALGIPVIGSSIGGIPELVADGETGLLFEPGKADELRDKIEQLLAHPDNAAKMGANARALAEREYNAELHYKHLMEIYNKAR